MTRILTTTYGRKSPFPGDFADTAGEGTVGPASSILLVRTRDPWWCVEGAARLTDLRLSKRARCALYLAGEDLRRILAANSGVVTAAAMAAELLAHRGSLASSEVRRLRAGAVVRVGVEGEASRGQPARFRAFRPGGEVLVAFTDHPACARPLRPVWSDAMSLDPALAADLGLRALVHR